MVNIQNQSHASARGFGHLSAAIELHQKAKQNWNSSLILLIVGYGGALWLEDGTIVACTFMACFVASGILAFRFIDRAADEYELALNLRVHMRADCQDLNPQKPDPRLVMLQQFDRIDAESARSKIRGGLWPWTRL